VTHGAISKGDRAAQPDDATSPGRDDGQVTDDLAQDLGGQETATLEWKREATDRHALRKAICALANDLTGAGGGVLLIGVAKDGSAYDGVDQGATVVDERELRGNLVTTVSALESLVQGHIHTRLVENGFRDEPQPDYPWEALREVIVNALIHRNYESSNAPVRISWFTDRVEITNPGGPFGQVRDDNFARVNDYRNPSVAAAMKTLGYANRFGRGITRVQSVLRANGNPPADFDVTAAYWSVTLGSSS